MFSKTMEFCNKGMVRADPLPPSYGQRPYFDHFIFWDPSLREAITEEKSILSADIVHRGGDPPP